MSYHVTYWKAFMCTKFRFGSILFAKAILKKPFLFGKNPVKTQKNKSQFNQNCSTKGVVDQPFVLC